MAPNFREGELVRIVPEDQVWELEPGEPGHCVFLGHASPDELWEWGDQVAGECDCLVLWKGEITPFRSEDLAPMEAL